jgi:hypothetical protein
MIATDAKFKAHPNRRECQKRIAGSQGFCLRYGQGPGTQQNFENQPFDRHAGCAKLCIGQGCVYAVLNARIKRETLGNRIHDPYRDQSGYATRRNEAGQ